ncbi:Thiamine-triphosphatase [Geodia barretti]|uniref:Thiamine-triphosphatase n=1 Tax=Geodia barretti TaxID=519541 RepID=A0AA35WT65_GEOBA|nr:Thiamine-triphosphatase [Geodia barretti]
MIEVERKFLITPETRDRISSLGGSLLARKHLHDTYYDTVDHRMVQQDHWLRKRGERWELKYRHRLYGGQEKEEGASLGRPGCSTLEQKGVLQDTSDRKGVLQDTSDIKSVFKNNAERNNVLKHTDHYREETNEHLILAHLEEVFQIRTKTMEMKPGVVVTMDTLLECGILVPLVEVRCVRECYIVRIPRNLEGVGEKGGECEEVRVDLDECECGEGGGGTYGVGEVEIMVSSLTDVEPAAQKCRDLALQLGDCPSLPPGGKVPFCLKRSKPQLWETLLGNGVLRRP